MSLDGIPPRPIEMVGAGVLVRPLDTANPGQPTHVRAIRRAPPGDAVNHGVGPRHCDRTDEPE